MFFNQYTYRSDAEGVFFFLIPFTEYNYSKIYKKMKLPNILEEILH